MNPLALLEPDATLPDQIEIEIPQYAIALEGRRLIDAVCRFRERLLSLGYKVTSWAEPCNMTTTIHAKLPGAVFVSRETNSTYGDNDLRTQNSTPHADRPACPEPLLLGWKLDKSESVPKRVESL